MGRREHVVGRTLGVVGIVLIVAFALGADLVAPADAYLVLGDQVLPAPAVAAALCGAPCLGLALLTAGVALRRRGNPVRSALRLLAVGVPLASLVLLSTVRVAGVLVVRDTASVFDDTAVTLLRPPAGTACRIVSVESDRLRTSEGAFYRVSSLGIARPVASWQADEIQRPVGDGRFRVTWGRHGADVELDGDGDHPVEPSRIPVRCRP